MVNTCKKDPRKFLNLVCRVMKSTRLNKLIKTVKKKLKKDLNKNI